MKKLICALISCFGLAAFATPVLFTTQSLTGTVNNRKIAVVPDVVDTPLVFGTNLISTAPFSLQPSGGSVLTNLVPWGYTIKVDGWPRSAHIVVPDTTNVVNAASLINTNAFAPIVIYIIALTNYDAAGFTNADASSIFSTGIVPSQFISKDASIFTNANASTFFSSGIIPAQFVSIPAVTTNVNELVFAGTGGGAFAPLLRQDWHRAADTLFTNAVTTDFLTNNGIQWQAFLNGSLRYTNSDATTPVGDWAYTFYPSQYYEVTRADYTTNRVIGIFVGDGSQISNVNAANAVGVFYNTFNGLPASGVIAESSGLAFINDGGQTNGHIDTVDQELQLLTGNGPWNIQSAGLTLNRYPLLNTTSVIQNVVVYTNGAGSKFRLGVNSTTNGFTFIAVP